MSGFLGVLEMFKKMELHFNISISQHQRKLLLNAIYPLSNINHAKKHLISKDEIKEYVEKIDNSFYINIDKKTFNEFLTNYLHANLKDML